MWTEAIQLNTGTLRHLMKRLLELGCYNMEQQANHDENGVFLGYNLIVSKDRYPYHINRSDYVLIDDDNSFAVVSAGEYDEKYKNFFEGSSLVEHDIDEEVEKERNKENIGGSEMTGFGSMFENMFGGALGYTGEGMIRLGLNGEMAVKTGPDAKPVYKTYNVKTGRLTNVTNFCFDIGHDFFFVIPTTKVVQGDILIVDNHPKCVIENNDNKTIKVMDYENSAIQEIVPERHVFMGKTYFYRKVVSMFGSTGFFKNGKGPENMLNLAVKAKMFEVMAGKSDGKSDGGFGGLAPFFMMNSMFGGNGTGGDMFGNFANMFDFELEEAPEEDEEDGEESIEELEAKLAAAKAKKAKTTKTSTKEDK